MVTRDHAYSRYEIPPKGVWDFTVLRDKARNTPERLQALGEPKSWYASEIGWMDCLGTKNYLVRFRKSLWSGFKSVPSQH